MMMILLVVFFVILLVVALVSLTSGARFAVNLEKFSSEPSEVSVTTLRLTDVSTTWTTDGIPRTIHQTAPNQKEKWHHIWEPCQKTWHENFKDFTYKMWDDEAIDDFMRGRFPSFYPIFKSYSHNIYRFDVFRYFLLYEYGGIYVDMDFECVKNFFDLLPNGKVSIAESAIEGELFQNALMASPPKHPFWHYVLYDIIASKDINQILQATGPLLIGRVVNVVPKNMFNGLPSEKFSVQSHPMIGDVFVRSTRQDIYAIHHGSCSYCHEI